MRQLRPSGHLRQLLRRGKKHECDNHAERCPDCLSALHRERQYLERLRSATVPEAPKDLTARLLARTEELARTDPEPPDRFSPPMKFAGLAAAGAATTAGALGLAALIMGGDPSPLAGATAGPASAAGASLDGGATPTGTASARLSVEAFRSEGWLCPELSGLGLHVVGIGKADFAGEPALELRLTDGEHFARIIEQHPDEAATGTTSPQDVQGPVNVLTGHSAAADGFSAVMQYESPPGGSLWVNRSTPWTAIYQAPGTTFTYVSDLPAERADDALLALAAAAAGPSGAGNARHAGDAPSGPAGSGIQDAATESVPEDKQTLMDRFQRGLHRIFGPLMPR